MTTTKKFFKKFLLMSVMSISLMACENTANTATLPMDNTQADNTQANTTQDTTTQNTAQDTAQHNTIKIDWSQLDTKVSPVNADEFGYAFGVDSQPVLNYAKAYNITAKQAQHAMTLSMASPEALNKVLDQLQGHYLGHSLTDGAKMSLVIYTTDDVQADSYEYVFADNFAKGLVLPIQILPASQAKDKPQVDIQSIIKRHTNDAQDKQSSKN